MCALSLVREMQISSNLHHLRCGLAALDFLVADVPVFVVMTHLMPWWTVAVPVLKKRSTLLQPATFGLKVWV